MSSITLLDSAFVSAVISAIISALASVITYFLGVKNTRKEKLEADRNNILQISVEYPYLEYPIFCNSWDRGKVDDSNSEAEKYIRYEMYTILVFNHLEDVCKYYNFDVEKISKNHVDIKGWLQIHKQIWKTPLSGEYDNINGYDDKFVALVNKLIQ